MTRTIENESRQLSNHNCSPEPTRLIDDQFKCYNPSSIVIPSTEYSPSGDPVIGIDESASGENPMDNLNQRRRFTLFKRYVSVGM
ncbi:hypothetical protein V2J09_000772 [Rumex salicifolius]